MTIAITQSLLLVISGMVLKWSLVTRHISSCPCEPVRLLLHAIPVTSD